MRTTIFCFLAILLTHGAAAEEELAAEKFPSPAYAQPRSLPEIRAFLAAGFGEAHPDAPPALEHFGQLAGLWDAQPEMRAQDGSWHKTTPSLWAWKYTLGGFAVQDLWLHSEEHLPSYLATLGRSYLLSSLRTLDRATGAWHSAWAANGGGQAGGPDQGALTGKREGEAIVLYGESPYGKQRVIFSEISRSTFLWTSEFSQGGDKWTAVMRIKARRRE